MIGATTVAEQVESLLLEVLETELGQIKVYAAALECARDPELKATWKQGLQRAMGHARTVIEAIDRLSLNPSTQTAGRLVIGHLFAALVTAIHMARDADPEGAERVAAECVVLAETKEHLNWTLVALLAERLTGDTRQALKAAHEQVKAQEDGYLSASIGRVSELWVAILRRPDQQILQMAPEARRVVGRAVV